MAESRMIVPSLFGDYSNWVSSHHTQPLMNSLLLQRMVEMGKFFMRRILTSSLTLVVLNTWSDFLSRTLVTNIVAPHDITWVKSRNLGMGIHAVVLTGTVICIFGVMLTLFGDSMMPNPNTQPLSTYRWEVEQLNVRGSAGQQQPHRQTIA